MSQARYWAGATGKFTGTVKDDGGTAIPVGNLTTFSVTVEDQQGTTIVTSTDLKPSTDANGAFTWNIPAAATTLSIATNYREQHVATFEYTYTDSIAKKGVVKHYLDCVGTLPLCTFEHVQLAMGDVVENHRDYIELMIEATALRFEKECRRGFRKISSTQVFTPTPGTNFIRAHRYPIASVTSLKESLSGEFASATALEASSYEIDSGNESGFVYLRFREWTRTAARGLYPGSVQLVYTGGLCDDWRETPLDLQMACARQVAFHYKNRTKLGARALSVSSASVSMLAQESDLLEDVRGVLMEYRARDLL